MFAQTAIDSTTPNAGQSIDAASSAIWWLIPLAIGCLGLIWYLRRLNNSTSQKAVRTDTQKRTTTKAKLTSADEPETSNVNVLDHQVSSGKSSSKKKKKGQASNQRSTKKSKEKQFDSKVAAKSIAESIVSSKQSSKPVSLEDKAMDAKAPAVAQMPSPPPVPVVAIFEPLRSVAPPRRKSTTLESQTEEVKPKSVSEESGSRPSSGGKFERMVPSTSYTRAAANRWPASMTNAVVQNVAARPSEAVSDLKPLSTVPAAVSIAETAHSVTPPAKGLKSFVSKRKAASASGLESNSGGSIPEELTKQ